MRLALTRVLFALVVLSFPTFSSDARASEDTSLESVLAAFDEVQASIKTLTAEFTETTRSALLKEPIVARGRFYMTKPDRVRWEYTKPEEMRFVIADNEYTGYFPERKRAERRDIQRWREQLFRLLGFGQASRELAEFYEITLETPSTKNAETYVLVLDPKKKRVKKRLEDVRLWVDRKSYLPVRVEYGSRSGTRRVIEFSSLRVNPELSASLYHVELPPDIPVTRGFSALSSLGNVQAR